MSGKTQYRTPLQKYNTNQQPVDRDHRYNWMGDEDARISRVLGDSATGDHYADTMMYRQRFEVWRWQAATRVRERGTNR